MSSKAKAILSKFSLLSEEEQRLIGRAYILDEVLKAMKEIASLAFAAGMDSTMKNTTLVHKTYQTGKKTDIAAIQKSKEDFISKLFNNE